MTDPDDRAPPGRARAGGCIGAGSAAAHYKGQRSPKAAKGFKERTARVAGIHPRMLGRADHDATGWANQAVAEYINMA